MTIHEAFQSFMLYGRAEKHYAAETLKKFRDCFNVWIARSIGDKDPSQVSRLDILQIRLSMTEKGVGVSRQYSVMMTLKLFFKFCRNVLKLPAMDPHEIELPRRKPPFVHYLTNEEVQRLRAAIPLHRITGLRMRVLVEVLLSTGMRISEALSLDRTPFEQGESEVEIVGKGGKRRTVFFTEDCLSWIKKYLYKRLDSEPALFITTGIPRRVDRADISYMFIKLRQEAQIDKPVTPHILRHTYCTNLRNHGADISIIKELAGHQDIQTTARYYLGVDKRTLREAVKNNLNYEIALPT